MRIPAFIVIKKKRSPLKVIFIVLGAIVAAAAALMVAYKLWGEKLLAQRKVIGKVDLDGDGEIDALMLDTNGDGEVDTIIIQSELEDEQE